MVLRKRAPPHLHSLSQGNALPESHSPSLHTSPPIAHSAASASSPKRLTRPRRAQSSPHPNRPPSCESVYSPDLNTSPAFDLMPLEQAQQSPIRGSPADTANPWADELVERPPRTSHDPARSVPPPGMNNNPANGGIAGHQRGDRVPEILVAGTQRRMAANEWQASRESGDPHDWEYLGQSPTQLQSNNPFLKTNPNPWEDRNSGASYGATSSVSHDGASGRLGHDEGYIPLTARLSLLDQEQAQSSSSPWAEDVLNSATNAANLSQDPHAPQGRPAPIPDYSYSNPDSMIPIQGPMNAPFDGTLDYPQSQHQQQHDPNKLSAGNGVDTPISTATSGSSHVLIELDDSLKPDTGLHREPSSDYDTPFNEGHDGSASRNKQPDTAPPLPDRSRVAKPDGVTQPSVTAPPLSEAEEKRQQDQRSETYLIRHVNWTDATGELRESPTLVQNKNGPCPLLALVNALVLRAGRDNQQPIVRALQNKEQISLGLLIEALFDELTTCLGPKDEIPDIDSLSQFLTMLHTGMNVNPRFTLESGDAAGSFEQTKDIRLYSTFGVPLVHGWIADPASEENIALKRVSQYHEDFQLLPFRKQELEARVLRGESLTPEEEQNMADIQAISHFAEVDNATQLSAFGLDHLKNSLPPGTFSILFRNDHFSTLYKHPQLHRLFTLVTDAGYAGHAEVVWESLVDVSGAASSFYSGDFRSVDHTHTSSSSHDSGQRTSSTTGQPSSRTSEQPSSVLSPQEQADADYAYALSLQYQEEQERSNESRNPNNNRVSVPHGPVGRREPPRPGNHSEDGPPPTYEQSAHSPIYSPRRGGGPPRRSSAHLPSSVQASSPYPRNQFGRRPPGTSVPSGPSPIDRTKDRSKDCVIM